MVQSIKLVIHSVTGSHNYLVCFCIQRHIAQQILSKEFRKPKLWNFVEKTLMQVQKQQFFSYCFSAQFS